jgi:hypothetical protein
MLSCYEWKRTVLAGKWDLSAHHDELVERLMFIGAQRRDRWREVRDTYFIPRDLSLWVFRWMECASLVDVRV